MNFLIFIIVLFLVGCDKVQYAVKGEKKQDTNVENCEGCVPRKQTTPYYTNYFKINNNLNNIKMIDVKQKLIDINFLKGRGVKNFNVNDLRNPSTIILSDSSFLTVIPSLEYGMLRALDYDFNSCKSMKLSDKKYYFHCQIYLKKI